MVTFLLFIIAVALTWKFLLFIALILGGFGLWLGHTPKQDEDNQSWIDKLDNHFSKRF